MRGFTLLELVVVIAVLGILLGIALPSYRGYILRVNRTEAVSALLEIAGCQEQLFAMQGRFDTTACLPGGLEHYTIRMEPANESETLAYTAWADPAGAQERDSCGSLGLDQTGLQQVSAEGVETMKCWRAGAQ
jgi:type IV pilus assembly protein PilE